MVSRFANLGRKVSRPSKKPRRILQCESLESRQLLAVVTSLANTGPGTLREAIQISPANEVITFAVSGTINTETQLFVNKSLVIDGTGQSVTINNIASGQRIFNVGGVSTNATIRNVTITGGDILNTSPSDVGGGVRVQGATLNLENSVVSGNNARVGGGIGLLGTATLNLVDSMVMNNIARQDGGGINVPANTTLNVSGSTIEGNTAGTDSSLGFLALGGGVSILGTGTMTDSVVRNNTLTTSDQLGFGGGISVFENASLTVDNSEISGNFSDRGGGITTRLAVVTIRDSLISGNTSDANGGGIRVFRVAGGPADITIENTTFADNVAGSYYGSTSGGGAIGAQSYANSGPGSVALTIRNSTFSGNTSPLDGGAIETSGADVTIENSTFYGNVAGLPASGNGSGGAMWISGNETYTGSLAVRFSTISGNNSEGNGGGIWTDLPGLTVENSILSGNMAASYADLFTYGNPGTLNYNIVEDSSGNYATATPSNIVGVSANLGPLQGNGGPTDTMLPNMGSPAINGADPAATLAEDQRGYSRPGMNASRDIGSVETDGVAMTVDGDFNNDGFWNCDDINMLSAAIATSNMDLMFDMNGDGMITLADITEPTVGWLAVGGANNSAQTGGNAFLNGDANLSGSVDGSDFGIWNSNKFSTSNAWCSGDFNASGGVDGSDFGIWNGNKFTSSDANRGTGQTPRIQLAERGQSRRSHGVIRPIEMAMAAEASRQAVVQFPRQVATAGAGSSMRPSAVESERGMERRQVPLAPASTANRWAATSSPRSVTREQAVRDSVFSTLDDDWKAIG